MEPWHRREENQRTADSLHTFIIICEGEINEPIYFKYFETTTIKINTIPNQKSKTANIRKAIEHCIKENILVYQGGETAVEGEHFHICCVYDRDIDQTSQHTELTTNVDFDTSIQTAAANNLNVAWSNDSFELWILLHFEKVDPAIAENSNRAKYYQRLTEVFKSYQGEDPQLKKILAIPDFNYKTHMKGKTNFLNIVRRLMIPGTMVAIQRAAELFQHHANPSKPPHQMTPCTCVHLLVQELLDFGGKVIQI